MFLPNQGNLHASPLKPQDCADRAIRREGLGARSWQLAVTQDAEAVPRLKGQRKRHCSMRLKPTDRRPANRLALALHTRSCCEICLLRSQIYSPRQYTRPLLLLTSSFTSLPFALPHVRRSCAQPSAFRNYRIIAYRPHSACCRIPRIFCQGCMLPVSSPSRVLHSFFPSTFEYCFVARGPGADVPNPTVCSHHGRPTEEEAEQSARW